MIMEKKFHLQTSSDRISDLPEYIKQHILSYLSTKNAVQTSILSSSWRTAWAGRPSLDLSSWYFGSSLRKNTLSGSDKDGYAWKAKRDLVIQKRERFYDFLDRAFRLMTKLDEFKFYVPCFGLKLKDRLDHWLGCAVGCRVKDLVLDLGGGKGPRYSVARSVLNASSITKLRLKNCELNLSLLTDTQLPHLQVLDLSSVYLDEIVMGILLASCPNLEEFTYGDCYGLTRLKISGLTKIERVRVGLEYWDELRAIEIEAPSLLEFSYTFYGDFCLESCEIALVGCRNMKKLELDSVLLDDYDFIVLLKNVPVLEKLMLRECHNLEFIKISGRHLVDLNLCTCRNLEKVELDTPNLQSFSFFGENGQDLISLVSKGPILKLKDATIHLRSGAWTDQWYHWYVRLIKLLAKLSHSDRFYIVVHFKEDIIIPEEVRMKYRPPLHGVKHLKVGVPAEHTLVELLESLLWLAPCPESICIYNFDVCRPSWHKLFKFTYELPLERKKNCGCWRSLRIKCWRHSLNQVLLESEKRDEDYIRLAAWRMGVWLENESGDEGDRTLANFFRNSRIDGKHVSFVKNTRLRN